MHLLRFKTLQKSFVNNNTSVVKYFLLQLYMVLDLCSKQNLFLFIYLEPQLVQKVMKGPDITKLNYLLFLVAINILSFS